MRRKHPLISVLIILMLLGLTLPAAAITFGEPDGEDGEPDGEDHPYVGLALFYNENDDFLWSCSGTLLSSTVFLTAGHCTYDTDSATIWFDSDLSLFPPPDEVDTPCEEGDLCSTGETIAHPYFGFEFPNTRDVGIVILDMPIEMVRYGNLPVPDELYSLATRRGQQDTIIRTVGYGLNMVRPFPQHERKRYTSTSKIVNLRSHLTDGYNIHTSNNPGRGQGTGGSCLGDSGGPIFYPKNSDTVVGVVSFGLNNNCKGADFAYRTDIPEALDFIYCALNSDCSLEEYY